MTLNGFKLTAIALGALTLAGCSTVQRTPPLEVWPDMRLQERFEAQRLTKSETLEALFADGRESRRRPDGVVARGHLDEVSAVNTGMENGLYVGRIPVPITEELIDQGQARFNVYCAPCHDQTGLGKGMVPRRFPAWQPQNLMEDRIIEMADGDIFDVITYGRRTMPPYGFVNTPEQRWSIIAYVRTLQRTFHGTIEDVPQELRTGVEYKPGPPPPPVPEFNFGADPDFDEAAGGL